MEHRVYLGLGQHRGAPRIWLQGQCLRDAGALPGVRFRLIPDPANRTLVIEITDDGDRRVSSKGPDYPVVDINFSGLTDILGRVERLKVVFKPGKIVVTVHPDELATEERLNRLQQELASGVPLTVGSVFHGGGVMEAALHEGFKRAGIETEMGFAIELNGRFLEASLRNNPVWRSGKGVAICGSADDVELGELPKVSILQAGIPCDGASLSGRARRRLTSAEGHPDVGHLFVTFLNIVKATQPAVIVMENVAPYQNTASWAAISAVLKILGYDLHETILDGNEMGALEGRKRLCAVAVTHGQGFSWDGLCPVRVKEATLGEILDPAAGAWSEMAGLKAKQARDQVKYADEGWGTGFKMQIVDAASSSVPTVCKDYYKVRSTEPKVQHPSDPNLLRQLTPAEHAAVKGIPFSLVAGEVLTVQHQILGQSVIYPAFVAVGQHVGLCLRGVRQNVHRFIEKVETAVEEIAQVAMVAASRKPVAQQLALF
ncbi:MAG: DNA cytosine methyltransferase [Desulfovibrio sp.]|uniref:DNA cytosine methyltransferase n=1 Tax=Desulfovibrio sp. TaxID=885 RepID=UPI00135DF677|nr:DNA cytosine methyltransferase [Desulfovibrio sp.]MTJ94037.1 DNA cytosine methyltransferase [Desulfovibrio sp.]